MDKRPLAIELFAGKFGWGEGLVAEGYRVIGFDIVHEEWHKPIPEGCELVLQDVMTLHGSQFKAAALIVASPPCQAYSYMAMPWSRAKALAQWYRDPESATERVASLTALFDACFRIQREASEAAGRYIPMVVENVNGAQKWVGRAKWHYGSFYLYGDVPALMPTTASMKNSGGSWFGEQRLGDALKVPSITGRRTAPGNGVRFTSRDCGGELNKHGRKGEKSAWFNDHKRNDESPDERLSYTSSKSHARKAASAAIAKIPFALASHIARVYR